MAEERHRQPGRPFFDPDGASHLDLVLRREVDDVRRRERDHWSKSNFTAADMRPHSPAAERGRAALREISEAAHGLDLLFGPGVGASVRGLASDRSTDAWMGSRGVPQDRLAALDEIISALDNTLRDVEAQSAAAHAETERLESELVKAQSAYDLAQTGQKVSTDIAVKHQKDLAWLRVYRDVIEARWRRLYGGRSVAAARRDARRQADELLAEVIDAEILDAEPF